MNCIESQIRTVVIINWHMVGLLESRTNQLNSQLAKPGDKLASFGIISKRNVTMPVLFPH